MWDGFFTLLTLSSLMALASFLAGSLPLSFKLSQRQLRLISALGTGVLVGTALVVIIPEGIETLYSSSSSKHVEAQPAAPVMRGGIAPLKLHGTGVDIPRGLEEDDIIRRVDADGWGADGPDGAVSELQTRDTSDTSDDDDEHPATSGDSHGHTSESSNPHAWVGLSLIAGFILMYLIDTVPHLAPTTTPSYRPLHISLANLSQGLHHADSPSRNHSRSSTPSSPALEAYASGSPSPSSSSSTTIGLIIHAIADGIALGASTATGGTGDSKAAAKSNLSFIIFLAIMVHKAPAAFGLTAVLLKQGLSKRLARAHLVVFSLAAPAGAFATWACVNLFLGGQGGSMSGEGGTFWTGVVLVFSGGTFLYVAMHSMQSTASHDHSEHRTNGTLNGYAGSSLLEQYARKEEGRGPSVVETLAMVVGMLAPLFTQIGHAHAHG